MTFSSPLNYERNSNAKNSNVRSNRETAPLIILQVMNRQERDFSQILEQVKKSLTI